MGEGADGGGVLALASTGIVEGRMSAAESC